MIAVLLSTDGIMDYLKAPLLQLIAEYKPAVLKFVGQHAPALRRLVDEKSPLQEWSDTLS